MQTYKEPNSEKIKKMFTEIAPSYDKANNVLSLGIHHYWKKKLVELSEAKSGDMILDTATGTGDLAILFKKVVGEKGKVVATDFCEAILSFGPQKSKKLNLEIEFKVEDVTQLSFTDNLFDISSISFGIRNVNNLEKAITELARVTKSGGKVMILEFGQVKIPLLKHGYNLYSEYILPKLGGLLSGKQDAYQYLNDSSLAFPAGEDFKRIILSTGKFKSVSAKPLWGGLAYIYRADVK